ncbi:MAG TPA: DinB family protein [Pyrinomonadaceae bacterium]|nr:DinB family protein [Pyrinomonadaceae bacterium]
MLQNVLIEMFERDLAKLKAEVEAYANEGDLWRVDGEITNSAGNLCLHLAGNLRHFFGSVLGGTDYVRDRDAEFSSKFVPRATLLAEVDAAASEVKAVLEKITDEDLQKNYPVEVFGHPMTTEFFIVHLATHLNYHLGQINYHRRIID